MIYPPALSSIVPLDNKKPHNVKVKEWKSVGQLNTPFKGTKGFAPTASMQRYVFEVDFKQTYLLSTTDINLGNPNIYIVYDFNQWTPSFGNTYPFHNCLFGSTNSKLNGRGIAFDSSGEWTHSDGTTARNVLIFGTDNSKSLSTDNKKVNVTALGSGSQKFINNQDIEAEAMFKINFTKPDKKFVLSIHYNGNNSYLYVNGQQIYKFVAQNNPARGESLGLGIISKNFPEKESKEVALDGKVYEFSIDFRNRSITDIEHIHSYLIKKHDISS